MNEPRKSAWEEWESGRQGCCKSLDKWLSGEQDCMTGVLRGIAIVFVFAVAWFTVRR